QQVAVVHLQLGAVAVGVCQAGPIEASRDDGLLAPRRARAFVRHLEEEKVGELLNVIAVREAIVAQDVAIVPQFLDDLLGLVTAAVSHELAASAGCQTGLSDSCDSAFRAPPRPDEVVVASRSAR